MYDDVVVRSELKKDLTLGASGHGAPDASGDVLAAREPYWK
jgi:hypothetical protein